MFSVLVDSVRVPEGSEWRSLNFQKPFLFDHIQNLFDNMHQ